MIWLYVLLSIILLLALVIFPPINFIIEYKERLKIRIKFCGIPFYIYGRRDEKLNSKETKKEIQKHQKRKDGKKDIMVSVKKISMVLQSAKDTINQIAKKIKIYSFKLILYIGAKDAAETAIKYGQASAIIYPITSIINTISAPEKAIVNIIPNFPSEKIDIDFKINIKSSIFNLIVLAIVIIRKYKKII